MNTDNDYSSTNYPPGYPFLVGGYARSRLGTYLGYFVIGLGIWHTRRIWLFFLSLFFQALILWVLFDQVIRYSFSLGEKYMFPWQFGTFFFLSVFLFRMFILADDLHWQHKAEREAVQEAKKEKEEEELKTAKVEKKLEEVKDMLPTDVIYDKRSGAKIYKLGGKEYLEMGGMRFVNTGDQFVRDDNFKTA